jgi:photosystem II stability/assembly factor-like uncharacterized protein
MNKIYLLASFLLFLANLCFAQCITIYPIDAGLDTATKGYYIYRKVIFIHKDTGWLVGMDKLYQTIDGGITWKQKLKSSAYYADISIFKKDIYILDNDSITISKDSGVKWKKTPIPSFPAINNNTWASSSMDYINTDTLSIVGAFRDGNSSDLYNIVHKTYDGGKSWHQKFSELDTSFVGSNTFQYIKYLNKKKGFATTYRGAFYRTNDGGETWALIRPWENKWFQINSIHFIDSLHGWACGGVNRWLLKTSDGGETWEEIYEKKLEIGFKNEPYYKIIFTDSLHGWIGSNKGLHHTTDGGKNWKFIFVDSLFRAKDIFFTDPHHAWIVGNRIYKLDLSAGIPDCHVTMLTDDTVLLPFKGAVFSWQQGSDCVEGYRISLGTSPFGAQLYDHLDLGNTTTWVPPVPLPDNTQLYVTVYPYSTLGTAIGCQTFSYQTTEKVGVEDLEETGLKIRVVPNPFLENGTLSIYNAREETAQITFIDALGRVVTTQSILLQKGKTTLSIPNSGDWAVGYCTYIVTTATKNCTGKLVKM